MLGYKAIGCISECLCVSTFSCSNLLCGFLYLATRDVVERVHNATLMHIARAEWFMHFNCWWCCCVNNMMPKSFWWWDFAGRRNRTCERMIKCCDPKWKIGVGMETQINIHWRTNVKLILDFWTNTGLRKKIIGFVLLFLILCNILLVTSSNDISSTHAIQITLAQQLSIREPSLRERDRARDIFARVCVCKMASLYHTNL